MYSRSLKKKKLKNLCECHLFKFTLKKLYKTKRKKTKSQAKQSKLRPLPLPSLHPSYFFKFRRFQSKLKWVKSIWPTKSGTISLILSFTHSPELQACGWGLDGWVRRVHLPAPTSLQGYQNRGFDRTEESAGKIEMQAFQMVYGRGGIRLAKVLPSSGTKATGRGRGRECLLLQKKKKKERKDLCS